MLIPGHTHTACVCVYIVMVYSVTLKRMRSRSAAPGFTCCPCEISLATVPYGLLIREQHLHLDFFKAAVKLFLKALYKYNFFFFFIEL